MSPINWLGGRFDKGYHFFDGFSSKNKKILENLVGKKTLILVMGQLPLLIIKFILTMEFLIGQIKV